MARFHCVLLCVFLLFALLLVQSEAKRKRRSECSSKDPLKIPDEAPKWPHPSFKSDKKVNVDKTIVITKAGTYDYSGKLHIWRGEDGRCDQNENGPQILRIEADNVVVKNFHFRGDGEDGSRGLGDPIHITTCGDGQGYKCPRKGPFNVTLKGVIGHACEDLITVGTPGADRITIRDSVFYANPNSKCIDKTVQFNFGTNILIANNTFVGGVRAMRFKSRMSVVIKKNTVYGASDPIRLTVTDSDFPEMITGPSTLTVKKNRFVTCKGAFYSDDAKDGKIIESQNTFENCPVWKEDSKLQRSSKK